ncbi:tRNA guanosine(34) transglycosylase Tgt [bacterium DOLJORAL78_65_58]|nr:MAG: tRNA guanosine(34) transglycosylase Tgt [bacterium DOLZORAL124_64_63]PIE76499.1 MAG: tRNA guanosine(34) transglycosylase Tgt [bacterium DOLJORAL78_65_58]
MNTHPLDTPFRFERDKTATDCAGRRGRLVTGHGVIETPVFMPVGTVGSVKAVTFENVWATGARIILGNTYHLYLRPGHELIARLGGLHKFQGWDGALLTDSAGFQVFSLGDLTRITEDGVHFRSHLDGSRHFFSPEVSMEAQLNIGADIIMAFDQCAAYGVSRDEVTAALERTTRWLHRCRDVTGGRTFRKGYERVLFGIMQGGVHEDLRRRSAEEIVALDLPGYAVGGLSVGEPTTAMREITELSAGLLPADKPRYLMGVGFPDDIVAGVAAGIDMFDCVLPTRMARTGTVLTRDGRLVIRNQDQAEDSRPIDAECGCPVCARHSRAYIRHLFSAKELLGPSLASIHNLHFYQELMLGVRRALEEDRFAAFAAEVTRRWQEGEAARLEGVRRRVPGGRQKKRPS